MNNNDQMLSNVNNNNISESQEKKEEFPQVTNNEQALNAITQEVIHSEKKELEQNAPKNIIEDESLELLKTLVPNTMLPQSVYYPGQTEPKTPSTEYIDSPKKKDIHFSHLISTIHFNADTIIYDLGIVGNLLVIVGDQFLKVYNIENNELLSSYIIPKENLYCISLTIHNNEPIVAIGGQLLVIRIINLSNQKELRQLIGHKNEIYDLKFNPKNSSLLLSASKDTSVRLWNWETSDQICIFGGPLGHIAEVLAIEWHASGDYFASSGIDNCVKLWSLIPKIKEKISNTMEKIPIKTLIKTSPFFSCNTIHDNYIDCIRFNGNFLITKSVDGVIKEWLPLFNKEGDSYYLINTFSYITKDKIWYIKFAFDIENNIIMIGNEFGRVHMFKVPDSADINEEEDSSPYDTIDTRTETIIRSIVYSNEYNICAYASNKGDVIINKLNIDS